MSAHFNAHMGKMSKELGEQTGKTFRNIYSDSMEGVSPNWTSSFVQEFIKRCGYDPLPWLPTLTGQIVETEEQTDRFLWDFRRTIGDLIAENFYGLFKDMSNKPGLEFIAQAPGPGAGVP